MSSEWVLRPDDLAQVHRAEDSPSVKGRVNTFRIALANLKFPATREKSVESAEEAISRAGGEGAGIICFPECFVPGYRAPSKVVAAPDSEFLDAAWSTLAAAAAKGNITVVLGTERVVDGALFATALVLAADGTIAGWQDKVQIDPS